MRAIFLYLFVFLISCSASSEMMEDAEQDVKVSGDTLIINANSPTDLALSHYKVKEKEAVFQQEFTAKISPITGQYAMIHPPFSGKIENMLVQLGQEVKKGQTLFTMQVQEIFELQERFSTSQKEWAFAQLQFNRQQELYEHGILSQQDFEDAQQSYYIHQKAHDQLLMTLKLWNLRAEDLKIGQALPIVAPINGKILKTNLAPGAWIQDPEESILIIGNTSEVWGVLLLKPQEIKNLSLHQEVEVWNEVLEKWIIGKIHFISSFIDPEHRHIEVYVHINNTEEHFKLGAISQVKINTETESMGWVIPTTALIQKEKPLVLIKKGAHRYVAQEVSVTSLDADHVLITEGLDNGDEIISSGSIYLLEFL